MVIVSCMILMVSCMILMIPESKVAIQACVESPSRCEHSYNCCSLHIFLLINVWIWKSFDWKTDCKEDNYNLMGRMLRAHVDVVYTDFHGNRVVTGSPKLDHSLVREAKKRSGLLVTIIILCLLLKSSTINSAFMHKMLLMLAQHEYSSKVEMTWRAVFWSHSYWFWVCVRVCWPYFTQISKEMVGF